MANDKQKSKFAPAKRANIEILKKQNGVFEKELCLPIIANAIPNMLVILNKERQIVYANNLFIKNNEYSDLSEVLGLRPGEALKCIHAFNESGGCGTTEFCRYCGAINAVLQAQKNKPSVQECRITTQNNQSLDLEVMTTPLKLHDEMFTIFAIKDISDEKRREALERIFFHDVLNSAGGISGLTEMLMEEKTHEELPKLLKIIHHTSENLIEEIKSQQQLYKAENGDLEILKEELSSQKILMDIKESYTAHQVSKDKHIDINDNCIKVKFTNDPVLIRRILGNMTKNALEATLTGGVVRLSCTSVDSKLKFTVHNDAFIPKKIQLQMFKRSFTTKGVGRGIGTYSMKLLGEKYLGGTVGFETNESQGTVFYLEIPIQKI